MDEDVDDEERLVLHFGSNCDVVIYVRWYGGREMNGGRFCMLYLIHDTLVAGLARGCLEWRHG